MVNPGRCYMWNYTLKPENVLGALARLATLRVKTDIDFDNEAELVAWIHYTYKKYMEGIPLLNNNSPHIFGLDDKVRVELARSPSL
mgnify:CR=1 FL=1